MTQTQQDIETWTFPPLSQTNPSGELPGQASASDVGTIGLNRRPSFSHARLSPVLCCLTGADFEDASFHSRPADMSGSAVGRHGDSGSARLPLRAAADHPREDAAAAPPLLPPRAAERESHDLIAELLPTHEQHIFNQNSLSSQSDFRLMIKILLLVVRVLMH